MKIWCKKFIAMITTMVILLVGLYIDVPAVYAADSIADFTIVDGVLTKYTGTGKAVVTIPDCVTKIGKDAFDDNEVIEMITIPDSVISIENYAFYKSKSLTTVKFGKGLMNIGRGAFSGCENLASVDLSDTQITVVPRQAFSGDKSLTDVDLPETVTTIGEAAFSGCTHLGRINLPEGVNSIHASAFLGCSSINSLDLPDTLTYIGNSAFSGMNTLSSISIPAGIKSIGEHVFSGDCSLVNVYLPDSIKSIDNSAFMVHDGSNGGHGDMTKIYIPSSVISMYDRCLDLPDTTLKGTLTGVTKVRGETGSYIEKYVEAYNSKASDKYKITFEPVTKDCVVSFDSNGSSEITSKNCYIGGNFGVLPVPQLKGYEFKGWYSDKTFKSRIKSTSIVKKPNYTLYAKWEVKADKEIKYKGDASDFTISDGKLVKYTGNQSVVVVPEGVVEIGYQAFANGKDYVTHIILPDSLKKIDESAFKEMDALEKLEIPEGVTEIPKNMCDSCVNLCEVNIKGNITSVGEKAFSGCAFSEINLPDTVKEIGSGAFWSCDRLTNITLPESLEKLGNSAFSDCSLLLEVRIPSGVEALQHSAFHDTRNLANVYIADNTAIQDSSFNRSALKKIYVPETVTSIGNSVFGPYASDLSGEMNVHSLKYITGTSDTTAGYNWADTLKNKYSSAAINYEEENYNATISFNTGVTDLTCNNKKVIKGYCYGEMPVPERSGYKFLGWSKSQNSRIAVRSTDIVDESRTLYAVWADKDSAEIPTYNEPETPTQIPEGSPEYKEEEEENQSEYIAISTADELAGIKNNLSGNYRLAADIDLSGKEWSPIGVFTGILDGEGHKITGLTITDCEEKYVGLFGRVEDATIKNITFSDVNVKSKNKATGTGALAGFITESSDTDVGRGCNISNIIIESGNIEFHAKADVTSDNIAVGGVTGYMGKGSMTDCHNYANVKYVSDEQENFADTHMLTGKATSRFVGGITGYLNYGNIKNCSNKGFVSNFREYFGIFTSNTDSSDFVNEALSGVKVYNVAAGICAVAKENGSISNCYNTGKIVSYVYNNYNLFTINSSSGSHAVTGGIVGALYKSTSVKNCYNAADLYSYAERQTTLLNRPSSGDDDTVKGIMEMLDKNTVQAPFQSAYGYCAGIVGYSTSTTSGPVSYCINTGKVNGTSGYVYGIANGYVPTSYCRYTEEKISDKESIVGSAGSADSNMRCMSMNAEQKKEKSTYRTFDFDNIWFFVENSTMSAPQLYSNMESKVVNVEYIGAPEKTTYEYGEKLNLAGLKLKVTLDETDPVVYDCSSEKTTNYDKYTSGEQTIKVSYFGKEYQFVVNVLEQGIHSYSDDYTIEWGKNYATAKVTAKVTYRCTENSGHIKVIDATVTSEVTTPATCIEKGITTYTATWNEDGLSGSETTTEENVNIDRSNHALTELLDATYQWSGTNCYLRGKCNCCQNTANYLMNVESEVLSEGNCQVRSNIKYVATYTLNGQLYTDTKEMQGAYGSHAYVEEIIAPTPTARGYTLHTCSICGNSYSDNYTNYTNPDEGGNGNSGGGSSSGNETPAPGGGNGNVTPAPGGGNGNVTPAPGGGSSSGNEAPAPGSGNETQTPGTGNVVKVSGIRISCDATKIAAGKSVKLTAQIAPENASAQAVTWTTSNETYATVDKNGKVITKKAGTGKTVIITAIAKDGSGKKAACKIKILKHAVKSITLKGGKSVKAGKILKLKATVKSTGKTANKVLKWSSSNKKYATVDKNGNVITKKNGKGKTVTITAKSTDGTGKVATVKIKIQ
ncbi:MAG: leucine-rich repeat protein [Lachnospira sp.]|nr:leucine-rich repeat protein [Lachnospira sp.]